MNYPMDFDMSAAELIDACDKPLDEMNTCKNCILYRLCRLDYVWSNPLEEEKND